MQRPPDVPLSARPLPSTSTVASAYSYAKVVQSGALLSRDNEWDDASSMRRAMLVLVAVGALAAVGAALLIDRSGPCDALAERDLFDAISDFDESGAKRTMEEAVEAAFAEAGTPRQVDASDLDPIIRGDADGNLIHVGVEGYWVVLATVQDGDGFVSVERPRPCSILDRSAYLRGLDRRSSTLDPAS
jgi:hypothetical protein